MQREKMKYQKPVIHSVEVGQILPIAASPGGSVTVPGGGNASGGGGGGGTPPPMQSKPYDLWEYDDETYDDETAYEYGW